MNIGSKELGMAYTVGAHCAWDTYLATKGQSVSVTEAKVERVLIMHDAWCKLNKVPDSKRVTRGELMNQPDEMFEEMNRIAEDVIKAHSKKTIEAKSKNAESAEATS